MPSSAPSTTRSTRANRTAASTRPCTTTSCTPPAATRTTTTTRSARPAGWACARRCGSGPTPTSGRECETPPRRWAKRSTPEPSGPGEGLVHHARLAHAVVERLEHLAGVHVHVVVMRQGEQEARRRGRAGTGIQLAPQALGGAGQPAPADIGQHQQKAAVGREADAVVAAQVLAQALAHLVQHATVLLTNAGRGIVAGRLLLGELEKPQRKLHALTAFHLELELFDDLVGLHGARGEVERRRVFGVAPQTEDGLLEAGGVAGGDACQGYVLEAEEKTAGFACLGRAIGMQAVTQGLASVGELVEQHGDRHALNETGAAGHILYGGE